jgi:hypothetical protein
VDWLEVEEASMVGSQVASVRIQVHIPGVLKARIP